MVEQVPVKDKVSGSNPLGGAIHTQKERFSNTSICNIIIPMKKLLLNLLLLIDKYIVGFIKIPNNMEPNEATLKCLKALKEITQVAGERKVKFWVTGSWAITFHLGKYFRDCKDIDLTTKDSEIVKLALLLEELGYKKGNSIWPDMHFYTKDGVDIEYFSADDIHHIFSGVKLDESCKAKYDDTTFPVLDTRTLLEKYFKIFLKTKRSFYNDLIKLKILQELIQFEKSSI